MSKIKLRALEPKDIDFLYEIENDWDLWHLSHTQQVFSARILQDYIANADRDIYEVRQFRFAIEIIENQSLIGFIDLFDFDPKNKRAGVGIVILRKYRAKSYGKAALQQLIHYAFKVLYLHQLYANIAVDNLPSIRLFESFGFERTCFKKDWLYNGKDYSDELLFQLINTSE